MDSSKLVEELRSVDPCMFCTAYRDIDGECEYKECAMRDCKDCISRAVDAIEQLTLEMEKVRRERDAAINYIHGVANEEEVCIGCKYSVGFGVCNKDGAPTELWGCKCGSGAGQTDYWEWRGGCDENGGESHATD